MVNIQEYLNNKYPTTEDKKGVKKIYTLEINQEREKEDITEKLEGGELDLREYSNLEWVRIDGRHLKSPLTSLDASNCTQLTYLGCRPSQLTNLNVRGCVNLKELSCWTNLLTSLDLSDNHQLEILWASNNNFAEQDLSFLSQIG